MRTTQRRYVYTRVYALLPFSHSFLESFPLFRFLASILGSMAMDRVSRILGIRILREKREAMINDDYKRKQNDDSVDIALA